MKWPHNVSVDRAATIDAQTTKPIGTRLRSNALLPGLVMSEKPYQRRLREYREAKARAKQLKPSRVTTAAAGKPIHPMQAGRNRPLRTGDPIPGSRFYRAFCARCDEPMRVDQAALKKGAVYCSECDPPQLVNVAATTDDISPWQENAIRAMEG